jgi:hypothetical protein
MNLAECLALMEKKHVEKAAFSILISLFYFEEATTTRTRRKRRVLGLFTSCPRGSCQMSYSPLQLLLLSGSFFF